MEEKGIKEIIDAYLEKKIVEIAEVYIENKVKEISDVIEKIFKEKKEGIKVVGHEWVYSYIQSQILPEIPKIPPFLLEKTLQRLIEKYKEEKYIQKEYIKKGYRYDTRNFGLLLSALINRNRTVKEGRKFKEIKPLEIHLDLRVREFPEKLVFLGYKNLSRLIVKGNGGCWIGQQQRGCIIIEGNVENGSGRDMIGGSLVIKGDAGILTGHYMRGGHIIVKGNTGDRTGDGMTGGLLTIEGNTGYSTGDGMEGGELDIKGEVKSFAKSAFSPNNRGTITLKRTEIWRNGDWTREGRKMWERGEIPIE